MTGHCRHCDPDYLDCHDVGDEIGWVHASPVGAETTFKAQWVSAHCPMCAERERVIAAVIDDIETFAVGMQTADDHTKWLGMLEILKVVQSDGDDNEKWGKWGQEWVK